MQRRNLRVMLASEYPESRYFLRDVVEREAGAVIVGQAENATRALILTKNLRPDVAIIDSFLPHTIGLDTVPLSRIGGLDTAQSISKELPNTRVIVLTNLDTDALRNDDLSQVNAFLATETGGVNIPLTLHDLYREAAKPGTLVFANVEVKQTATLRRKITDISNKAVLFGGLGMLGGLGLMLTVILAGAGVVLASVGATTILLGLAGKLAVSLWPKAPSMRGPTLKKTGQQKSK